ncbi:MAG: hypothetical protein IJX77_07690 [Ruminococcus sp.]|nr:hypothetical protein [Ruminococcus sp.]
MKNLNMKRRIASAAAAAVMSVSAIGGSLVGTAYMAVTGGTALTALAANSSVVFTESAGYAEGAYAEWAPVSDATGYNVYCDGVQIDSMLIRQYSGYFRADAVGLKAGSHTLKVVPVISGSEDSSKAASVTVTTTSYDREGFCFSDSSVTGGSGIGAYNDDGTLKSNAVVLYVTEDTKNTITMDVQTAASKTTSCTGIGEILKAMQKGYESRPVAIRIIGKVTADGITTSGDTNNLLLKASSTDSPIQNVTVEGIGEDAVCYGFGIRCQRARSIEIRNLAVMLFGDDGIALETDNYNIWVHNNDIFYGTAGSDADQAKGDGSMDLKNDSQYITISYNHFWDSGKMSLCGMKSETGENFISYHHNWFDHSDSRHPRIRTMSVHVYNNYYDGNSKYGVGVTMGASAFVESNYFRNCQYPMMSSKQGTDALGEGTFSGENGGVIKAYGNIMEGQKSYITYAQDSSSFDAYEVSSPSETVPSSVVALNGGTSYTNFDTASTMYSYTPDAAADVPSIVMSQAGRVNGGDFEWEFNDSVDDTDYGMNDGLMSAIKSYTSPVIAIGSGFKSDAGTMPPATTTATTPSASVVTTTVTTSGGSSSTPSVAGNYVHNFTENGKSSSFYSITGNLSTSKGTVSYGGMTLTQCLKLESSTSITFSGSGTLTLVLSEAGKNVKVDGTKYASDANGIVTVELSAGSHTITKGDTANLFYMSLAGEGSSSTPAVTTTVSSASGSSSSQNTTVTTKPVISDNDVIPTNIQLVSAGGWNEMMYMVLSGVKDADVTSVSYSGPTSGTLTGTDFEYLVRDTDQGVRVDVVGLKPGTYSLTMETSKGKVVKSDISVGEQDRSGYAHYNYTAGVGAYNDDGTIKANAIVLYVTNENKDTVTVTSKDGTTVKGIGHILNSAGQDNGSGATSKGGTPNNNSDIIEKLAKDGTPLVIRIIGNVTAPDGLTAYDSIDYGGTVGDNGYMARMQSGKDVTIEGIGTDATINGWGIHFIAESANTDLGKSFEVRNIAFRNVPEDCLGMEGQQGDDSLTSPVERCWIHNCEFYAPSIANPAESDKDGGDGACDFKRGMYFTNSYCYYEGYHKTNLVGSSDTSLQYHLTYHHNYWKDCESRGPLARQADIHMYNNVYDGQTSYCQNPRANAFIFSEYNYFVGCKDICEVTSGGVVKSYKDTVENCRGNAEATVVTDKSQTVSSDCLYANFDTNSSVSYVPSGNYALDTDTTILKSNFETDGGCMDETSITSGDVVITPTPSETTTTTNNTPSTPATTTTTTQEPSTELTFGDADLDGTVTINDAVKVMSYVTNKDAYPLTEEQMNAADVYQRGDGLSNMDALSIQKRAAQLIASLPESYLS